MTQGASVIKRSGERPSEPFDADKLKRSIVAACLSVRTPKGEAHDNAEHVYSAVSKWCAQRHEITSGDIRRIAAKSLETYHPEAAYLYKHHRLVL